MENQQDISLPTQIKIRLISKLRLEKMYENN